MTDLDLTEAIEAAAWAVDPVDGAQAERRPIAAAIEAAAPIIAAEVERRVRETIVAEHDKECVKFYVAGYLKGKAEARGGAA